MRRFLVAVAVVAALIVPVATHAEDIITNDQIRSVPVAGLNGMRREKEANYFAAEFAKQQELVRKDALTWTIGQPVPTQFSPPPPRTKPMIFTPGEPGTGMFDQPAESNMSGSHPHFEMDGQPDAAAQ